MSARLRPCRVLEKTCKHTGRLRIGSLRQRSGKPRLGHLVDWGLQGTFAGRDEEREIKIQRTAHGVRAKVVTIVRLRAAIRTGSMMHIHRRSGHLMPCPGHRGHQHAKEAHQKDRNESSHSIATFSRALNCGLREGRSITAWSGPPQISLIWECSCRILKVRRVQDETPCRDTVSRSCPAGGLGL